MAAKRRMRFEIMEELSAKGTKSNPYKINVSGTPEEAATIARTTQQIAENRKNGLPADFNIPRAALELAMKFTTPFNKIAKSFINVQKGRGNSEQTIKHYEQSIRKLERFFCWTTTDTAAYEAMSKEEQISLGSIQPFAIMEMDDFEAKYREFLTDEEGVSDITVATYFRDYKALAYWMMDEGLIEKRTITIRTVEAEIKDCYTDEELDRLLKKPSDNCSFAEYRNWVVINWVLATGNRISTVVNVKIKDVNFDECMININTQKNKKVTRIPLQSKLRKILLTYINDWLVDDDGGYISEYLFPSSYEDYNNYPITREQMYKGIAEYNKSRGVNKTSFHLFRHTFVKNWIIKGGDLYSLQRILGHSTLAMVTKYANLYAEDLKPKVEDFSVLATHEAKPRGRMIKRRNRR